MQNTQKIKAHLLEQCKLALEKRYQAVNKILADIKVSLESETKSSAGDKHETGRAMLQLEREKAGNQLAAINREKQILSKIKSDEVSQNISLGSLVVTSQANYFLAISCGEIKYENQAYYAISAAAPIARLLLGKKAGDQVLFQKNTITIQSVL